MNELITLEAKKKQLGYEIRQQQRNEHTRLYSSHKAMFRLMDIAVVLIILMNFGAVALTNLMVVKQTPEIVEHLREANVVQAKMNNYVEHLREANVVQAKMNNYEVHPEATKTMLAFVKQALIWTFILFVYIYYRSRIWNEFQLGLMLSCVCFYFIICGSDFFNDFGFFIGKLMFGGNI